MDFSWLIVHILPSIGFILALALLGHILKERRPPTSTLAWLMAIVFIPYIGVPFYLILGGRKMLSKAESKPDLEPNRPASLKDSSIGNAYLLEPDSGISPPSANNSISFLPNGEVAFQTMSDLIQNARHSIYIATFILGNDETGNFIVQALAKKASQGLKVCLLLDALGSIRISRKFLSPLVAAGGQVAFFMPMMHLPFRGRANLRNHRKMFICDHQTAIIGGMNLASEYMGLPDVPGRWQDLSLLVRGPVIDHIADIFRSDWEFASKTPLDAPSTARQAIQMGTTGVSQLVASGPDVRNDSLRNAILTEIFRARRRIWVVTPYFVPDELLLEALCIAACRKVDISIFVPQRSNHRLADLVREGYLTRVQESGASIWLYEPRMLHAKAILVDDTLAMVGSANMDMRSLLLNYEIALCIYDTDTIGQLESWMRDLKKDCFMRKLQPKRSSGLIESVGRLFAPLL
ncbi:MAG: PLDc N-terminal domain-containing protein [Deltaproteobacteria bacterium]|jgi:cardiolipin synthase A/B|nr:PLDc N-terminal domain-containing protein [Deltaproteobacteria bacterium]